MGHYFGTDMERNFAINGWRICDFNFWLHGNCPNDIMGELNNMNAKIH